MARSWLARAAGQVASGLDQAFNDFVLGSGQPRLAHDERMAGLSLIDTFYNRAALEPELFRPASAIEPRLQRLRTLPRGGELIELRWPSAFEPLWNERAVEACLLEIAEQAADSAGVLRATALRLARHGGSFCERYAAVVENRTVHARWYRHGGAPRPCAVLLHGYASGMFALEARVWPIDQLYAAGLDVVQTVLPFHGPRRDPRRGLRPPAFPVAGDLRLGIEGMRQLVLDQRALLDYLHAAGSPALGVMGMSFGGYAGALLATLEARLQFAALVVPLAHLEPRSWSDTAASVEHGVERERERAALRRAQRLVSPFTRPSRLADGRCIAIAGELDRVTGMAQAEALAGHLRAELHRFEGGHLLQLGRGKAFAHVLAMLERAGIVP
jgi:pimeloyl-ACP methyl ester carboxylesterase